MPRSSRYCAYRRLTLSFPLPVSINHLVPIILCILTLVFAFPAASHAQTSTATLSGTVEDQNSALISGASIALINAGQGTQRLTTTDNAGQFVFPLLAPGQYSLTATREGFAPVEIKGVVLNVNAQVLIRIKLTVGTISQSVEIVDGASLINESPTVATVVDRQFVANLPMNGRSFQSLIALTPGVVTTKTNFSDQGQFSVNGQRSDANSFSVDGVSANFGSVAGLSLVQSGGGALPALSVAGGTNSLVSIDAMQEFKIQTSTFAPEFGRTPGAQISIATRSGTNEFHGTLFDYFRNDVFDANDWFNNARRLPKPATRQHDFGFVLGGPILLPRFGEGDRTLSYNGKDKTFMFLSYEGLRLRQPQSATTLVPSLAARTAASPQRRQFLNAYPLPNGSTFPSGLAEFSNSFSNPMTLDAASVRIDHTFNSAITLFGRFNYSPSEMTTRGTANTSLNVLTESRFSTTTFTVGSTQSNRQITNEIRANYSRSKAASFLRLDGLGGAIPPDESLYLPAGIPTTDVFYLFNIIGGRLWGRGKNVENVQRQINVVDNLFLFAGKHQLKFGIDYRRLLPINGPHAYDQFVFFSGMNGPVGATSGNAAFVLVNARDTVGLDFQNFSAYGQDTWRATPRLTFTYGLRWDVNPAPKGRDEKDLFTFDNLNNPAALSLAPTGTPLFDTTFNNFAPRIGFAYQLSKKDGKQTMLRGGFGLFYDLGTGILGGAPSGFPYTRTKRVLNAPIPLTGAQAAPLQFSVTIPSSGTAVVADRNLKLPRTYQWNMTLERSLGSNQTVSAVYVGAIGRKLLRQVTIFPTPLFSISITDNSATSDYHGMQLQFQRRLSRTIHALASYTWSHSIDIASSDSAAIGSPIDPQLDRGSSDFDVRHAFNGAVTYDLPSPSFGPIANALLSNWSADTIMTARSPTPVDLIAVQTTLTGFSVNIRPDLVTGVPLYIEDASVAGGRRFNKLAFVAPPTGRQGTLGRNVLRGFSVFQLDFALRRQFKLTEHVNLQFRTEAFNIFNHPNFGDPGNFEGNSLTSPFFGQSTAMLGKSLGTGGTSGGFNPLYQTGGPRSIQMALKLSF